MSKIEWTNETWNPITGCSKVSPGCDNCYMFAMYPRLRSMGVEGYEESPTTVQFLSDRLEKPHSWRKPRFVFVNSMSDMFHPHVSFESIFKIFDTMRVTQRHTYQILTKRPGLAVAWWNKYSSWFVNGWPANVWIGVSVENQKYAPRIDVLNRLPAKIKFVSAEPLLDKLDLTDYISSDMLQWVIVGGESGHGARAMDIEWAKSIRDQCNAFNTPFFLKQLGGIRNKRGGDKAIIDNQLWTQMPTL